VQKLQRGAKIAGEKANENRHLTKGVQELHLSGKETKQTQSQETDIGLSIWNERTLSVKKLAEKVKKLTLS